MTIAVVVNTRIAPSSPVWRPSCRNVIAEDYGKSTELQVVLG
jgi:hypothetical protein